MSLTKRTSEDELNELVYEGNAVAILHEELFIVYIFLHTLSVKH